MKTILLCCSILCLNLSFGQNYFGIEIAPGLKSVTNTNGLDTDPDFSLRTGLQYGYRFNETKPWGIESSLYYNQRGYRMNDITFSNYDGMVEHINFTSTLNNVGINLLFKVQRNYLYVSAGPSMEYNINHRTRIDYHKEELTDLKTTSQSYSFSESIFFGYEANIGTQFLLTDRMQFFAELSLSQVFSQKYEYSQTRTVFFNANLGLGLNYSF